MSTLRLDSDDRMACPHCGAELEGPAIEYVVPLRSPGPSSEGLDECPYCDTEFVARLEPDGTVSVRIA